MIPRIPGKEVRMERETPIIGYKEGMPIILCRSRRPNYIFYCQYCRHNHFHGIGDGHRAAHCGLESPFYETGYYLVGSRDAMGSV